MSRKRSSPVVQNPSQDDTPPSRKQRVERNEDASDKENASANTTTRVDEEPTEEIASPLRRHNPAGRPPEAGVIKKVYVENFMCHRKLTVDLCRNVNFIHGQNGSGKSAVLAAIQICLGAGARRTHRARNLKELVRKEAGENCSGAKVRVTLLNGGPDGFQPDVYGPTITVERTISLRGGQNGYKLLDHQGVEKSRSKKDLDAMLDQLNIQVENPVAVLDQEESKKFLTGKAEDKYAFFTKATELERIDRSYANVLDNMADLQKTRDTVENSLKGKAESVKKLRKEWQEYKELDKLEDKLAEYNVAYAWAFYNDVQVKVEEAEEKLETFQRKREKREEELTQAESLTHDTDHEQERKQERMDQLIEEANAAAEAKRDLEGELKRAKVPVKGKERELANINREQVHAARNLKHAKQHLQEERDKILAGSAHSDEARRAAALKEAEEELENLQDKLQELKQSCTLNQRKYEELDPSVEQAKSHADSLKSQLGGINRKIGELEKGGTDSLAMFGNSCAKVHKLVEQARRNNHWTGPVAGPIGAHIKVAVGKEKFAALAEQAIGNNTLDKFVVTNDRDRKLFQKIRQEARCGHSECGVYQIANSPKYRVPPPPTADVETVATCLNISEDIVFNALVDHRKIDTTALCTSKESSEAALLDRDNQNRYSIRGGMIREVYYLPDGDRWRINNGSLALISNDRRLKQTLGIDKTAAIEELKAEADGMMAEFKESRARESQLAKEHKEYKVKWNQDRQQMRKVSDRIEKLNDKISAVKAESEEAANVTVDTTELEEDVSKAEQVVAALQEQKAQVEREIEELAPTVRDTEARLEEVTARNEKVLADMNAAEQDLADYVQNLTQRQAQLDKKRSKLQQMQEIITKQEEHVQNLSADRDKALRMARKKQFGLNQKNAKKEAMEDDPEEMTPPNTDDSDGQPTEEDLLAIEPMETNREAAYYLSKIDRTTKQIEKERHRRQLKDADPEIALQKYMRAKQDLDSNLAKLNTIDENLEILKKDLKSRKKRWKEFRQHIVRMTNVSFNEFLNLKGSAGELEFDHDSGTLDLVVQKEMSQENSQTKDVKALSGGERSFTTLSLLLALGERLETPFRVMDEFDVFLDPVARKIALETLVTVAKQMVHRQFIFITPQDLSNLKTDPLLKIHHMKPPAKSATVGGPSQQTLNFSSQ